jgi:DNA-binding transcriptional regulator YdaS (Cro superfamily)
MSDETPLDRAIRAAGNQAALALKLGVTQQAISYWRTKGNRVPAEYVVKVETATGIPRGELRPDIFGVAA